MQTFTPPSTGNFAVGVTVGNCTDTSACTLITVVSLGPANLASLEVYPNPTSGMARIKGNLENASVQVWNPLGQQIQAFNLDKIDLRGHPNGVYLVAISTDAGLQVYRLVKGD